MAADEKTTKLDTAAALWHRFKVHWLVRAIIWARWIITLAGFLATMLWYAYLEGQDISETLSSDYQAVQSAQSTLIDDSLDLQSALLNSSEYIPLEAELDELRRKARGTIGALGSLRAPTTRIEEAQKEYRASLERLVAVINRIDRGDIDNMALPLHNGLQGTANAGGELSEAVRDFQGGMLPQLIGSVF